MPQSRPGHQRYKPAEPALTVRPGRPAVRPRAWRPRPPSAGVQGGRGGLSPRSGRDSVCACWLAGALRAWSEVVLLCFLPGPSPPLDLPPPEPADPSAQDLQAESWGSQDISVEKSVLRRVQLGHGNKMSLRAAPATGPSRGSPGSPPGNGVTQPPRPTLTRLAPH